MVIPWPTFRTTRPSTPKDDESSLSSSIIIDEECPLLPPPPPPPSSDLDIRDTVTALAALTPTTNNTRKRSASIPPDSYTHTYSTTIFEDEVYHDPLQLTVTFETNTNNNNNHHHPPSSPSGFHSTTYNNNNNNRRERLLSDEYWDWAREQDEHNTIPYTVPTKNRSAKELWSIIRTKVFDGSFRIHDYQDGDSTIGNSNSSLGILGPNSFDDDEEEERCDDVTTTEDTTNTTTSQQQIKVNQQDLRMRRLTHEKRSMRLVDGKFCSKDSKENLYIPYEFSIWECTLSVVIYLFLGVLAYSYVLERWPIVDSLYFTVVTLTSVGYGDLTPSTEGGRLFTCFFALTGVALLGFALGIIGDKAVEAQVQAVETAKEETSKRILSLFHQTPPTTTTATTTSNNVSFSSTDATISTKTKDYAYNATSNNVSFSSTDATTSTKTKEHVYKQIQTSHQGVDAASHPMTLPRDDTILHLNTLNQQHYHHHQGPPGQLIQPSSHETFKRHISDISVDESILSNDTMSYTSLSSAKASKYSEKQPGIIPLACSEMCSVFFHYLPALIPLFLASILMAHMEDWSVIDAVYYCVVTTTTIGFGDYNPTLNATKWIAVIFIPFSVGCMAHVLGTVANDIIEKRRQAFQNYLGQVSLKVEDLHAMDTDGDGLVSKLEYVEFMLLAMKKIDRETLYELHDQFDRLNVTRNGMLSRRDLEIISQQRLQSVRNKLELTTYRKKLLRQAEKRRKRARKK